MCTSSIILVTILAVPALCQSSTWYYPNKGNLTVRSGDALALSWSANRSVELDIFEINSTTFSVQSLFNASSTLYTIPIYTSYPHTVAFGIYAAGEATTNTNQYPVTVLGLGATATTYGASATGTGITNTTAVSSGNAPFVNSTSMPPQTTPISTTSVSTNTTITSISSTITSSVASTTGSSTTTGSAPSVSPSSGAGKLGGNVGAGIAAVAGLVLLM